MKWKRIVLLIICLLTLGGIQGQTCITFQEMEQHGLSMDELDPRYPNAVHPEDATGPFTERQQAFSNAWLTFHTTFLQYLKANGLSWDPPTDCFCKIYFTEAGKIDYWFFNFFKKDNVPADKQARYLELVREFSKTHTIEIQAETPFSQCSTVTLMDLY